MQSSPSPTKRRKQDISFVGHVPDAVRASEASNAGQKSFEHLIGIFEGSSPLEDEFIKGKKSEGQFLSTYDPQAGSEAVCAAGEESDLAVPDAGLGARRQPD